MSDTTAAARAVARRGLRLGSAHAARSATSMRMPESARLSAQATVRRAMSDTTRGNLTVFRFDERTRRHTARTPVEAPRRVLSVRDLIETLSTLIAEHPEAADLPVHLLDMSENQDQLYDGLLTDVTFDVYDDDQGLVLDLVSWPEREVGER